MQGGGWGQGQGYGAPPGPAGYGPPQGYGPAPMMAYGPAPLPVGCVRCPYCGWVGVPIKNAKITTAGWVLFAVLLVVFFPLFWIGLLVKETKHRCPACQSIVSNR